MHGWFLVTSPGLVSLVAELQKLFGQLALSEKQVRNKQLAVVQQHQRLRLGKSNVMKIVM